MPQTDLSSPHFVISARSREGFIQQTRTMAASAVVLALSWRAKGHHEVTVIDRNGMALIPESYREDAQREHERRRHLAKRFALRLNNRHS